MVQPGLEAVASDEIARDLGGDVRKTGRGFVVFRVPEIDAAVLRLRTTEDVFLYAWGTDKLTYRAVDLDSIRRWTAKEVDWQNLLRIHHAIRPKPKGKPTYRLVTQMTGTHGYRRIDAQKALAKGLAGKLPASWNWAEENAAVEVWLTIENATAYCGLRLSDRTMRHRTWKHEHLPASLRPTVAAAMVRLADCAPGEVLLDPMCGGGTILAEYAWLRRRKRRDDDRDEPVPLVALGGDCERQAVQAAAANLRDWESVGVAQWDATRLPLGPASVSRIVSNPPFGKQLSTPEDIEPLYQRMVEEYDRVLQPGGRAVLVVSDLRPLRAAARAAGWHELRKVPVRILGQPAVITVWRKPEAFPLLDPE
jgi:23S rRNA G2445 N2-methylase RlmL